MLTRKDDKFKILLFCDMQWCGNAPVSIFEQQYSVTVVSLLQRDYRLPCIFKFLVWTILLF